MRINISVTLDCITPAPVPAPASPLGTVHTSIDTAPMRRVAPRVAPRARYIDSKRTAESRARTLRNRAARAAKINGGI